MIRLFKKLQARKIIAFTPERYLGKVEESKNIAQKEDVPRYLTRGIILKLKKKQSINNALAFASVAFTFYRNNSNVIEGKKKARKEVASNVAFPPSRLGPGDRYNKNINSLKKRKPSLKGYIINSKPVKMLQKKTRLIGLFHSAFLEIKPFFKVLQKFTRLLFKKNLCLVREAYPFIYVGLKGASTIGGFKKVLYNKILVQDRKLKPAYNRRKHNITHYMVVQNQFARLDKAFVYLGKNKLASMIGLVLKTAYSAIPSHCVKTKKHRYFNNTLSIRTKAIPNLVSIIEGQVTLLLWRNQFNSSLIKSRQDHRQGISQNLYVVCKNNSAVLLKK